jgi:hypothetical protein
LALLLEYIFKAFQRDIHGKKKMHHSPVVSNSFQALSAEINIIDFKECERKLMLAGIIYLENFIKHGKWYYLQNDMDVIFTQSYLTMN